MLNEPMFIFIKTILPTLNRGLLVSLTLILPSVFLGSIFGFLLGTIRAFCKPWIKRCTDIFTLLFRGTPLTVQLMILYFGLPNIGIYLEPFPAAVLGFTLCTAAYQSEYVCAALLFTQKKQLQAAYALGFSPLNAFLYIVIPQAMRQALPGCSNEIIYLIKYSSLAYLITCIELTGEAKILVARTFRPTEVYVITSLYYLCLVSIATWLLKKLEKRLSLP